MKSFTGGLTNLILGVLLTAGAAEAQGTPSMTTPSMTMSQIDQLRQAAGQGTVGYLGHRKAFADFINALHQPFDARSAKIDADGVPGLWVFVDPSGQRSTNVILYIHGGGFYSGSSQTHRVLGATLAKDAGADVFLIDYRRMPEATYPAQIDDALTAYRWLLSQGYPADHIAVAGESVGGNLVLELALHLLEQHQALPSSLVAMSPIADLTASGKSMVENARNDPLLTRAGLLAVTRTYMHGGNPRNPDASPAFADLHGLPPLLLQVAAGAILLDDSVNLARKAALAGVATKLEIWPGMTHQWQLYPEVLPQAAAALQHDADFIRAHFGDHAEGEP
jgi:monoterpene epsilon-lactone hydrolase